jgi:hypothetical protein
MDDSAVLELDSHRLVVQLHQEPAKAQSPPKSARIRAKNCTKRISEVDRIYGKEYEPGVLDYLTSFILEALGGGRRGGGKARVFAGGAAASS